MNFPKRIFSGYCGNLHCRGIAVDEKIIYYSFTTKLIKSDIDRNIPLKQSVHRAYGDEISELSLSEKGECSNGIYGYRFKYGAIGMYSFGNGYYYFSQSAKDIEIGQYTNVVLYDR